MAHTPRLSLMASFVAYSVSTIAVILLCVTAFVHARADRAIDGTLDRAVRLRTEAAALEIARALESDWKDLSFLASALATNPERAQALMDGVRADGHRVAWIGMAGLDGRVNVATSGMLLGADVRERPWYQSGLQGPFGGDVHDAKLLAQILGSGDEPLRFVDLARPVRAADGTPLGVVGMHINATWLHQHLTDTARSLGIELLLVDPSGAVSLSSLPLSSTQDTTASRRMAATGAAMGLREKDDAGRAHFSAIVPTVVSGDLPNFGWRLVGRMDTQAISPTLEMLRTGGMVLMGATTLALAALSLGYALIFLLPIAKLGDAAARITQGAQDYPPLPRATREASAFADALVDLQHIKAPHAPDDTPSVSGRPSAPHHHRRD